MDLFCASCLAFAGGAADSLSLSPSLSSRDLNAKNAAEERAIKAEMDERPQKF